MDKVIFLDIDGVLNNASTSNIVETTGFIGVDEGYIEGLFVHKDYRGLGVGTKLIAYVLQYYDFIELDVFEKNYGAVCFYENRNFQKLRSLPHEDLGEIEYRMCYRKKKEE